MRRSCLRSIRLRFHQRLACFLHVHLGRGFRGDVIRSIAGAGLSVGRQSAYVRGKERAAAGDAALEKRRRGA